MDSVIKNTNELEFAIFCIENLAKRFHTDGKMMCNLLAEQSDILNDYIVPEYEGIPYDLVVDGKVMYKNLEKLGKNYVWLKKQTEKLKWKEMMANGFAHIEFGKIKRNIVLVF